MNSERFGEVYIEILDSGLDPNKQLKCIESQVMKYLLEKLENSDLQDTVLEKNIMRYKANELINDFDSNTLYNEEGFDFRSFISKKGYIVDFERGLEIYENDSWAIHFTPSPDDTRKYILAVLCKGDETIFTINIPSTEEDAQDFLEGFGLVEY